MVTDIGRGLVRDVCRAMHQRGAGADPGARTPFGGARSLRQRGLGIVVCTLASTLGCVRAPQPLLETRPGPAVSQSGPGVRVEGPVDATPATVSGPMPRGTEGPQAEEMNAIDASRLLAPGFLGLAAIGMGAGVGLAISSSRLVEETHGLTQRDQARHAALAQQVTEERTAMVIGFATSALFASLGMWLLLSDGPAETERQARPTTGWSVHW